MIWNLIIGGIAGWLAGLIMKGGGYGIIVDVLLGIAGGWIGNWLFDKFNIHLGGTIGSIATSVIGAVILIGITRLIKR